MGTKFAPAYSGIFLANLEGPFLETRNKQPALFKIYIDNIFVI